MELQIQDLVSSIKRDGIETANAQAAAIVEEANKKAESIVADAKIEAQKMLDSAKAEIEVFSESAKLNAEQAKRDAVIAFEKEIQRKYEKILSSDISKALDTKTLSQLILAAVKGEDLSRYTVEVKEVTDTLTGELATEIRNGLEIRPSRKVGAGFRLAAKDGSGYFDCSEEEISRMLMPFLRDIHL